MRVHTHISYSAGGVIPFGMTLQREVNSICTNQLQGIQGKEGECEGWIPRDKSQGWQTNWNLTSLMGSIPVTTTTKIFPKVRRYKWEAYCNTNGGDSCDTNGRSTDNTPWHETNKEFARNIFLYSHGCEYRRDMYSHRNEFPQEFG